MRIESDWNQPSEHLRLMEKRVPYHLVTGELMAQYFERYNISIQSGVLELGAGSGELIKNVAQGMVDAERTVGSEVETSLTAVPALLKGWVCTDVYRRPLAMMQERILQNVPKMVVSSSRLPFESNSFPVVTDLAALDVVVPDQLPQILAEARRVLKPAGRFIHFQDLSPDPAPYLEAMLAAGFVSIPDIRNNDTYMTRLDLRSNFPSVWVKKRLFAHSEIMSALQKKPALTYLLSNERRRISDGLTDLARDPLKASRAFTFLSPVVMHEVAVALRQFLTKNEVEYTEDTLSLNDWFTRNLTHALAGAGFEDVTVSRLTGERFMEAGRLMSYPGMYEKLRDKFNDFSNTLGVGRLAKNPEVPKNMIKVSSTIEVVSARIAKN